jgi:hypothetical protein
LLYGGKGTDRCIYGERYSGCEDLDESTT